MNNEKNADQHYERGSFVERLKTSLIAEGFSETKHPRLEDLAPLDQFHSRGLDATIELAQGLNVTSSTRVIDIGSGLGGPSRYLAETYGCTVKGIDLSESFVEAANFLAQETGLGDRVSYQCANALSLPFESGTFDVAWSQHVAMNIADRATLYREAFRVLRPGGRFAIFDVVAASELPLHFPVPWATNPETSFLVTMDKMLALLREQGFHVLSWTDSTGSGIAWFTKQEEVQAKQRAAPALGLHMVMGPEFRTMVGNLSRNLREGRAALIQLIVEKRC